ncbi:MAG: hypothetical protein ONB11_04860 [candidate division KSB1 bacterium]|nr:hypothetical protein [candidate division KSB1 bacterium]MDZ7340084.1 hypothetical protein [candidate division KSB1 bacterium]
MKNSQSKYYCWILIMMAGFLLLFCKNPFATREPEPPTEGRTSWQLPTDPIIVLENMKNAIKEKNVENYMKCLVDSMALFRFIPGEFEASTNAGIFENWNLLHEQSYINKAFSAVPDDSVRSLAFSRVQRSEFPDSALIRAEYALKLNHIMGASIPRIGKGQADFWFIRRNGYWVIRRWIDYETKSDTTVRIPSWSTIKANFIN